MPSPVNDMTTSKRSVTCFTTASGFVLRFFMSSIFLYACWLFLSSTPVLAIEALPGSTWGTLTDNNSSLTGSGSMGWINQGIDWFTLPGGITLDTYVEYRFRHRTKNNQFYDAQGPAVGLELKKWFLRLGTDYYWVNYPKWPEREEDREYYLTGYYDWDVNKLDSMHLSGIKGLPGSIWFNMAYDAKGLTGSGGQGWINQGIDWFTLPGGVVFNTYAEYRYRHRTKENQFYDAQGPALGLEFKKSVFRLGMDYYWENDPKLPGRADYLELYLTWYVDWDLKKLIK